MIRRTSVVVAKVHDTYTSLIDTILVLKLVESHEFPNPLLQLSDVAPDLYPESILLPLLQHYIASLDEASIVP